MDYKEVLKFWFEDTEPQKYWMKDKEFDRQIKSKFGEIHKLASEGGLASWREEPDSSLAEIIILDQFSRNIYRDSPKAFENDSMALTLAEEAVEKGFDNLIDKSRLLFLYLPYMHSENRGVHKRAVELFLNKGLDMEYELKHKAIIDRFGRYPHRNDILGRESTPEELEFLKGPDSSF